MRLRTSILLFLTFLVKAGSGQLVTEKIRTLPGSYTMVAIDNLESIYLLSTNNQLKKLNENGDSVAVYNNVKKLGQPSLLDVSNPLRVLLYYRNFATLVMLDRLLTPVNSIDLRRQQIFNAEAVGLSYDGKIWLYDNMENVLKKIDDKGSILSRTPDFRQLFNETPAPQQIIDRNKQVYIYDSARGIYTFDYYGAYKGKIAITHWRNLRITDKYIYGNDNDRFYRYTLYSLKFEEWPIPGPLKNKQQYIFEEGFLYTLDAAGISIYSCRF
ncbi:hypothetical protein [Niabella drilacis]|uniref:Uncharacterized protein n=1 Tax=Niabella drilacis (strain DSM 25811 / CCM 8410 / CCUG 62505 / LMG 26954 / E90) TaxID=1285928 RepID=A0A1G6PQZ4_NIADE|nr:hypothetical protein [Niabella drilacis]SDC82391.1 hypothetical protein SAMN04487894_104128 [Niabella drilacis]